MKKLLALLLAALMVFALVGCGNNEDQQGEEKAVKIGFIFLHDENSTYDKNFMGRCKRS